MKGNKKGAGTIAMVVVSFPLQHFSGQNFVVETISHLVEILRTALEPGPLTWTMKWSVRTMTAAAGACISLRLLVGAVKRGGSQPPLAS